MSDLWSEKFTNSYQIWLTNDINEERWMFIPSNCIFKINFYDIEYQYHKLLLIWVIIHYTYWSILKFIDFVFIFIL